MKVRRFGHAPLLDHRPRLRANGNCFAKRFRKLIDKVGLLDWHAQINPFHDRGRNAMTVKIYGPSTSRISRNTWCCKELGIPFETVEVPWDKLKEPAFLEINPNGKSPGFTDGNLNLFESLAINLYLAKKYGSGELYPTNAEDEARVFQWTLWAAAEVEHLIITSVLVK